MSNEAFNQHINFGTPLGDGEGLYEIADWAGDMLRTAMRLIKDANPPSDPNLCVEWLMIRDMWFKGQP